MLCLGVVLTGCGNNKQAKSNKVRIVATNFAAYDFARQVGGAKAEVELLLPPGTESHSFEPTPREIKKIAAAQVFVCAGGESEEWVDKLLASVGNKETKVIKMMECVPTVEEVVSEGMQGNKKHTDEVEYDEHVWTAPTNALLIVGKINKTLQAVDAANATVYQQQTEAYTKQLTQLDQDFRHIVATSKRKTLVFGDRFPFRYFVDAYGLKYFAAFPGCAHDTEASAATLAFLINKVKTERIPVVLHTELSNEKVADIICEATGAAKKEFNACHNVTKEQMNNGVTYLDLMQQNAKVLKEALN